MPGLRCAFRLIPSHGRNERGFGAEREDVLHEAVTLEGGTCLGLSVERLSITPLAAGSGRIEAFLHRINEGEADTFLDQLEVALTAHFGLTERNAYYGTVYLEFDRANLEWQRDPSKEQGGLEITDRLFMKATENHIISEKVLKALRYDPLLQLYADGLRANSAKSKFFHWFIILEEFLEKANALNASFKLLFDEADQDAIHDLGVRLGGRKKGTLLGVLRSTEENRAEKLARILNDLGIATVSSGGESFAVNADLCDSLIKQRNKLFHRGAHIEENLLYNALFPIVTELARSSDKVVTVREQQ